MLAEGGFTGTKLEVSAMFIISLRRVVKCGMTLYYNSYLAGIVESDDVSIVHGELNKAYNYAQNVSLLRTLCMRKNIRNTSLAFLVVLK